MGLWAALALTTARAAEPETLRDAWAAASVDDPRTAAAAERVEAADAALAATQALRAPVVMFEAGLTQLGATPAVRAALPPPLPADARLPLQQSGSSSYRGLASWPLYTGGRIAASIRAATAGTEAARALQTGVQADVRLAVARAYVDVLRTAARVAVLREQRDALAAHAADAGNLFRAGVVTRADAMAADVSLAEAERRRISAGTEHALARAAYNRQLSRPPHAPVDLADLSPPASPRAALEDLIAAALERREELAALRAESEAQAARAAARRAEAAPQLAITGGFTYQENRYQVHPGLWSIGIGLRWNVWDGGLVRRSAAALAAEARATARTLDDARADVRLHVLAESVRLDDAERRLTVAAAAREQAAASAGVARDQYVSGAAGATQALEAIGRLASAARDLCEARYDVVFGNLALARATGEL